MNGGNAMTLTPTLLGVLNNTFEDAWRDDPSSAQEAYDAGNECCCACNAPTPVEDRFYDKPDKFFCPDCEKNRRRGK
jgi:hypothetical protein